MAVLLIILNLGFILSLILGNYVHYRERIKTLIYQRHKRLWNIYIYWSLGNVFSLLYLTLDCNSRG